MYEDYTTFENMDARLQEVEAKLTRHYNYMRIGAAILGMTVVLAIV
jgi:hypothetical protein